MNRRKQTKKTKPSSKEKVKKVVDQMREPFSLLQTLKDEGLSNAVSYLSMAAQMASGASKNLALPQVKEVFRSLGFATREDLDRLEERLDQLEEKIDEALSDLPSYEEE
ncbi:MAG: hypothetical protein M9962_09000 [Oligoflexia bacterium]|nr:hypothetical protein [Oligoflexia bacterium]